MLPRYHLDKSIQATLAYLDLFDYPLAAAEVWRFLFRPDKPATQEDVAVALEQLVNTGQVGKSGELYFLKGREAIIATRAERKELNKKKWRRVKSAAEFLRLVPFVRGVFVCNSVAIDNGKKESDADLIIVAKPGRMFMARLAVTAIVQLMGLRRHGKKIADRVCLSFYVTDDALDFAPLRLQPDDPQLAFWVATFVPLLDRGNIFQKVRDANPWVSEYFPNAFAAPVRNEKLTENPTLASVRVFFESAFAGSAGQPIESWARNSQMKKMARNAASRQNDPTTDVVISDTLLKFHERDRRAEVRERFISKLRDLGLEELH